MARAPVPPFVGVKVMPGAEVKPVPTFVTTTWATLLGVPRIVAVAAALTPGPPKVTNGAEV